MKFGLTVCALLLSTSVIAQTPGPYNVTVHVTGSRIGYDCSGPQHTCQHTQTLHATIDGKQYDLQAGTILAKGVVALGDYPARLAMDEHKSTNEFTQQYTIQFPDRSTRTFDVIGVFQ